VVVALTYCCGGGGALGWVESDGGVAVSDGGVVVSGEAGVVLGSPALPPGVVDWSPAPEGVVVLSLLVGGGVVSRSLQPAASAPTAISGISRFEYFMGAP
jgi:hypothetical protein